MRFMPRLDVTQLGSDSCQCRRHYGLSDVSDCEWRSHLRRSHVHARHQHLDSLHDACVGVFAENVHTITIHVSFMPVSLIVTAVWRCLAVQGM